MKDDLSAKEWKDFSFHPGHETYPIYHNKKIQHIIKNAIKWATPLNTIRPIYGYYEK